MAVEFCPPLLPGISLAVQAPAQETAAATPGSCTCNEQLAIRVNWTCKAFIVGCPAPDPSGADPFAWWFSYFSITGKPAPGTFARSATGVLPHGFAANRQGLQMRFSSRAALALVFSILGIAVLHQRLWHIFAFGFGIVPASRHL